MIRVVLPAHLRVLAQVQGEVKLEVEGQATQRSVLDALEALYPMLSGTIRDHVTQRRRPFVRFFACDQDLSHESPDARLPDAVATGAEPLLVIGAIAGGNHEGPKRSQYNVVNIKSSMLKLVTRSADRDKCRGGRNQRECGSHLIN